MVNDASSGPDGQAAGEPLDLEAIGRMSVDEITARIRRTDENFLYMWRSLAFRTRDTRELREPLIEKTLRIYNDSDPLTPCSLTTARLFIAACDSWMDDEDAHGDLFEDLHPEYFGDDDE